jgi:hypothetical protein
MNKVERAFSSIDQFVDKKSIGLRSIFKQCFPFICISFLILFFSLFGLRFFYARPYMIASVINDDTKIICTALKKIDYDCGILRINKNESNINFLDRPTAIMETVGPLRLAYQDNWVGPYLHSNPTFQEKFYQIVKARDGFFVIPGNGTILPNNFIVGQDFEINSTTVLQKLLQPNGFLNHNNISLGAKITFQLGDWPTETQKDLQESRPIQDGMLKYFNETGPFTCADFIKRT